MITAYEIKALRELMAKATPPRLTVVASGTPGGASIAYGHRTIASTADAVDAALIVALVNAAPALLDCAEELEVVKYQRDEAQSALIKASAKLDAVSGENARLRADNAVLSHDLARERECTISLSRAERDNLEAEVAALKALLNQAQIRNDQWFSLVMRIGYEVKCLASAFPDDNGHVLQAITALKALATPANGGEANE